MKPRRNIVTTVRRARAEFGQLAQLGNALVQLEQRSAQTLRDRAEGVIELAEVAPGVFAMPAPQKRAQPVARGSLRGFVADIEGSTETVLAGLELLEGVLSWPRRK